MKKPINFLLLALIFALPMPELKAEPVTFFGIPVEGSEESVTPSKEAVPEEKTLPPAESAPAAQAPEKPVSKPEGLADHKAKGPRILVLFDVSMSVVKKAAETRFPIEKIKDEALKLINALPENDSVGVIQFTRNYQAFKDELVELVPDNRKLVAQWIDKEWIDSGKMPPSYSVKANPRAVVGVLEKAARMRPDVIYLISDGSFQWGPNNTAETVPWKEIADAVKAIKNGDKPVVLNFIGFQMNPEDKRAMNAIVRQSGGKLTEISKK